MRRQKERRIGVGDIEIAAMYQLFDAFDRALGGVPAADGAEAAPGGDGGR